MWTNEENIRNVKLLYFWSTMSLKEIAEFLEISESTVRSIINRR